MPVIFDDKYSPFAHNRTAAFRLIFSNIAYRPNLTLLNLAAVTPENHTISVLDDTIDKIPMDNGFDVSYMNSNRILIEW